MSTIKKKETFAAFEGLVKRFASFWNKLIIWGNAVPTSRYLNPFTIPFLSAFPVCISCCNQEFIFFAFFQFFNDKSKRGGIFYRSYLHPLFLVPSPLVNLIQRYVSSITCWLFPRNVNGTIVILHLTFSNNGRRWTCVDKILSLMCRVWLDLQQVAYICIFFFGNCSNHLVWCSESVNQSINQFIWWLSRVSEPEAHV